MQKVCLNQISIGKASIEIFAKIHEMNNFPSFIIEKVYFILDAENGLFSNGYSQKQITVVDQVLWIVVGN